MDKVEKILKSVIYCNLATVCEDGTPWNTPVFFGFDNRKNIYWWSPLRAVHSQNVIRNHQVFITVFDSRAPEGKGEGVYIKATADVLEAEAAVNKAVKIYNNRSKVIKLSMQNSAAPAPTRIFVARPDKIWTNIDKEEGGYFVDARKPII